jgi:tetratricopeptide (TPR) repeat protein
MYFSRIIAGWLSGSALLLCSVLGFAQSVPATLFAKANAEVAAGNHVAAIHTYEDLLGSGVRSAAVCYNLGNAYLAQHEVGKAILYYERAARLAPFDADITHNLAAANTQIKDDIAPISRFFLIRWLKWVRNLISSDGWAIIGLLCIVVFGVGMCVWLLGTSRQQKRNGFVYGLVALVISILPFWCAYELLTIENHSGFAIILLPETTLRTAADTESPEIMALHEGLKVELLDNTQDWYKIELPNGEQGWILAGTVAEI